MEILISILIFVGFFALSLALVAFMSYLICIGLGIAWSCQIDNSTFHIFLYTVKNALNY